MESHKVKQQELIEQLKQQLEDLERYAYETGEAGLPQTLIVERQKIIIGKYSYKIFSSLSTSLIHYYFQINWKINSNSMLTI